jgi:hypothetical protein
VRHGLSAAHAVTLLLLSSSISSGTAVAAEPERALFVTHGNGTTLVYDYARGQTHQVGTGNILIDLSPDGRLLSSVGGADVRYVRPGGAATVLASGQPYSYEASWGANSKEFVFTRSEGWGSDPVFVADVVENRVVSVPLDGVSGVDFAPHRRALAAAMSDGSLVSHDLTDGTTTTLVEAPGGTNRDEATEPTWAPSGDAIAYFWGFYGHELRLIDPTSGTTTVLGSVDTDDGRIGEQIAWSPDGSLLAYARSYWDSSSESDVSELVAVDRNGRETVMLTDGADDVVDFLWSGNSTLAFTDGETVREVNLARQVSAPLVTASNILSIAYTPNVDPAWLPLVATARATDDSCPEGEVPPGDFSDVGPTNPHGAAIDCVVWWQVAQGTADSQYGPAGLVSRAQMATFIARAVVAAGGALPSSPPDAFDDDDGTSHETAINQLAAAGIVNGTGPTTYGPGLPVSRAQMATFLTRTYKHLTGLELPAARGDYFVDDAGSPHEDRINRTAEAGIAGGTGPGTFNPSGSVRRDQMASFLARLLDVLVEETPAQPPTP